ncbi:ESX secretion-associated protein EspG [Rhodococcus sp. NPDC127528]|uniref:ESX secretion-associated protein EspG n=1 Tax=unclassified Rhodococcus (in: high G+C Gram-positive bacteria) TaxID=192944 RepID=UPI00362DE622
MTDQWRFTALEFDVLWQQLGRDRLPYPMRIRGGAATEGDFRRQRRAAARRVLPRLDEGLHAALSTLATPAVRVEVCGFHGRGLGTMTRAHAGVRGERATLARQDPGVDLDAGGDVVLLSVPAGSVAARIAAALPSARRGIGRGAPPALARPRAADESLMLAATRLGPDEACVEFFARPRTGLGEIGVFAGPALDWRPTADGRVVQWMDFEDDGRYLVRDAEAVSVVPAGGDDIAAELRRLIGLVGGER